MTEEDRKFLESKQEALRLSIALKRFFETDSIEWRKRYGAYLKLRIRPAMKELITAGAIGKIEQLSAYAGYSEKNLDEFIDTAVKQGKAEVTVYLMKEKKEKFGFIDQDFSL